MGINHSKNYDYSLIQNIQTRTKICQKHYHIPRGQGLTHGITKPIVILPYTSVRSISHATKEIPCCKYTINNKVFKLSHFYRKQCFQTDHHRVFSFIKNFKNYIKISRRSKKSHMPHNIVEIYIDLD